MSEVVPSTGVVTHRELDYSSGGNYITVDHGNGIKSQYLHCSSIVASLGDNVQKGQIIAKIGSTGVSTGPHLHLDFIVNGVKVDPLIYLNQ